METKITIKEAIGIMSLKWDVQIEPSDRIGYKWYCPDNQYENINGDEYKDGCVYFKSDKAVINYVIKVCEL